jgi:hypothetical protein
MHWKSLTPHQCVVKYIEFSAEFDREPITNLDSYGHKLNFVKYFMLDIFIPFLVFLFLLTYLAFCLCFFAAKLIASVFLTKKLNTVKWYTQFLNNAKAHIFDLYYFRSFIISARIIRQKPNNYASV